MCHDRDLREAQEENTKYFRYVILGSAVAAYADGEEQANKRGGLRKSGQRNLGYTGKTDPTLTVSLSSLIARILFAQIRHNIHECCLLFDVDSRPSIPH